MFLVDSRIENLRELRESMKDGSNGMNPELDAVFRAKTNIRSGLLVEKVSQACCL